MIFSRMLQGLAVNLLALSGLPYVLACFVMDAMRS
jgi:hypothetical protein